MNDCPRTAASWSSDRSPASSASSRAAISAWRVPGTASSPSSPAGSNPPSARGRSRPSATSIRIVSTAYRGMPSARATIDRAAASGRPGTRPASRSRIDSSSSGWRSRARKDRLPAPQPGLVSRSSGRASVMIRIGTLRLHSRMCSMKSRVPGSAQCRSSNSNATTPVSASRSKNVRHAENSSVAPPARRIARPEQREEGRLDPPPLGLVGNVRVEDLGDLGTRRRSVVALQQSGTRSHHLAQCPERDALAVRRATGPRATGPARRRRRRT